MNLKHQNIWAVGRNYREHAAEMKAEIPSKPFFFLKSGSCVNYGNEVQLPVWSTEVHHEIEIAFLIDENLTFSHLALAIDMTARDAQNLAKSKGLPWTQSKSFKGSCPISKWIEISKVQNLSNLRFRLIKNSIEVQIGHLEQMIFKPTDLLEQVKAYYPLQPNDVLLTGTPSGVSVLQTGDSLEASLQSEENLILTCHWNVK